jgi:Alpha-kinase family
MAAQIKTFNSELKREYISTCDMSNEESIQVSVVTAARGSMARTASARRAGDGKKLVFTKPARDLGAIDESCDDGSEARTDAFAITAKPVDWSAQEACAVVLYTNDPVTSMDQLKAQKKWKLWSRKAAPTGGMQPQDVRVQVAPQPFAQGALRWAFNSQIKLGTWQDGIVKLFKDSSKRSNTRARYLAQIEVSTVAAFLAQEYNKIRQPQHLPITFLKSHVVEVTKVDGSKEHYNLEPKLPPSEGGFTKFSNNTGYWNVSKFGPTLSLALFSRWTYTQPGYFMMVTDLQGVKTDLTDPVVLCHDLSKFGSTNLGPRFISCCMHVIDTLLAEKV